MKKAIAGFAAFLFVLAFIGAAVAQQGHPAPAQPQAPKDEKKRTSIGKYVTAVEAYVMHRENPQKVNLLDVRTPEEYDFLGHAPSAVNIPSKLWTGKFNPEARAYPLADNPDFIAAVKSRFKPDDTILVMCRSGHRSATAIEMMAKAGFTNVYQITDGFEGDKVSEEDSYSKGKRLKNGWRNSGVPWTYDLDPKLVYVPGAK